MSQLYGLCSDSRGGREKSVPFVLLRRIRHDGDGIAHMWTIAWTRQSSRRLLHSVLGEVLSLWLA